MWPWFLKVLVHSPIRSIALQNHNHFHARTTAAKSVPITSAWPHCFPCRRLSAMESATAENDHNDYSWTVCDTCHGQGKRVRKRQSKKARWKQRQQSTNGTAAAPTTNGRLWDICAQCRGSGLQKPLAQQQGSVVDATDKSVVLLHVAIIGGGLAGLALAAALRHRRVFGVTVYERDDSFTQRSQGYGLTLQQAAPQLTALGIPVPLSAGITSTKHLVHETDGTVVGTWGLRHWQNESREYHHQNDDSFNATPNDNRDQETTTTPNTKVRRKRQNVHIARQALRHELWLAATSTPRPATLPLSQSSVDDANAKDANAIVQWGHRLVSYQEMNDHIQLTFVKGTASSTAATTHVMQRADIVVGADGIRSQVRQQLLDHCVSSGSGHALRYLGCIVILGICPMSLVSDTMSSSSFAHLLDGETVFQTANGVTRMYMMPFSSTEYMWQLSFPLSEAAAADLAALGARALHEEASHRCGEWHAPIPDILRATPLDLVSGYPVYDQPILQPDDLQRSESCRPRRVTCVGDAIHCMSPFKGQGANQALLDALSLARALYQMVLAKHGDKVSDHDIEKAILEYELEMLKRSAVKVNASAEAAHFLHTPIAIQAGNVTRGAAAAAARNITENDARLPANLDAMNE
jgi:salicylate hydroxylase